MYKWRKKEGMEEVLEKNGEWDPKFKITKK